ncbi:MAG: type IV pilin N-terminal domain-containing protein [Methanoregula sp.]|nr:type IV pilin N-terminal domain-containing protein [Methanoregula sp.]
MKIKKTQSTVSDTSSGVSELIGGIMMITVVVAAAAIIGVILFSQQTPEKVPSINFMAGSDNSNHLYLYHNGGDTLTKGTFSVLVDNTPRNDYSISDGGTEWSLGKNLILNNVPSGAHSVAIIYNATGSGEVLLRSASSSNATLQNSISPSGTPSMGNLPEYINGSNPQEVITFILQNTSLIGDAMNQSPSTVGPVIANVVGANSINFFKDNGVELDFDNSQTYYFTFNVTKAGSSIAVVGYTPNPKPLLVGDRVTIYMRTNTGNFKTFGLGSQLWEISATGVDVELKHFTVADPQSPQSNTAIQHGWITGYQDLGSTVGISTTGTSGRTSLIVNGTQIINGLDNTNVVITNIRPVGVGLFVLQGDNSAHTVYFVGNAQSVTRGGVPVV